MRNYISLMAALLLATAGCSPQNDEPTAAVTPAEEPQHVWKDQVQALDKAKQVEQTLMDAQQRRIESQPE